jgi:uncharacterized protein YecE (DUF72 family)
MENTEFAGRRLGLCGWNGSQAAYFAQFDCIEIQSTFYDPPRLPVVRKWPSAAPADFQFCLKAWQLITHTAASPTYRRLRSPLPEADRNAVGAFRPTAQVWHAWQRTLEIAEALDARVILFQCPKSFLPTGENLQNLSGFFHRVDRGTFRLAWEPRGEEWNEDLVRELCAEHSLIHCVDPLEARSVYGDMTYWRLHGRGSYAYRYTDADLNIIRRMLLEKPAAGYVMFNNFSSKADAQRLISMQRSSAV